MKKINVAFDFWIGFDIYNNFIVNILKKRYDVRVLDVKNDESLKTQVEYFFFSCFSLDYIEYSCVRIFFTGENQCPDFNLCDYAIGFDYIKFGDRYIRYPLYLATYDDDLNGARNKDKSVSEEMIQRKFCSWVVSNSVYADPMREKIFRAVSSYKKVDSGGKYLNNIDCPGGVRDKREFQTQYKFSLALENSAHDGYVTEKIVQSFAAHTVPIYWGDPSVSEWFNEKAFVNCNNFNSMSDLIAYVREIDCNTEWYIEMLRQPAIYTHKMDIQKKNFESWIYYIFDQEWSKAFRRNQFGRINVYEEAYHLYNLEMQKKQHKREKLLDKLCLWMGKK